MQNNPNYPIIAKEGWPFIIGMLLVSWGISLFDVTFLNFICFILTLFTIQFFRDPQRKLPNDNEKAVLSPADGKIVVVEKTVDPFRNKEALKISVFMNVFNVHSNHTPLAGKVEKIEYFPGSFLNAELDKASKENERNAVLLKTNDGDEITFVQIAGLVARRILCYVKLNQEVRRGERYGFIRFGSRVDIYLPVDSTSNVSIGDKVSHTSTVIAYLSNKEE